MIYLRPTPKTKPVKYIDSIEKAGLIVAAKESIAMYTLKGGGATGATGAAGAQGAQGIQGIQGIQGVPGVDQNSWYDTIIASCSDEITPITVDAVVPKTTFRAPYPLDLATGYIRASVTTAPTGAALEIDVHMNGVTLFSTLLTIDATEKTSVTAAIPAVLNVTDIPDDAEFEVFVTQVGSTIAGAGLKVAVTGIKTS